MFKFINSISRLTRFSQHTMVIAAAAIILLGVIAFASIPDADGIIHGCYKKSGGTLRVIDDAVDQCDSRADTAIQWNQTGPQGPAGPRGPSDAWFTEDSNVEVPDDGAYHTVLTLSLPSGSYVLMAQGQVQRTNNTTGTRAAFCRLGVPGGGRRIRVDVAEALLTPYTLTAPLTLTEETNAVVLECVNAGAPQQPFTFSVDGTLTAIQVANLHEQY